MEDFLSEISEQFIQQRVNRLKERIEVQKKSIENKICGYRKELINILTSKVSKKSSAESSENADQIRSFSSFIKSSESKGFIGINSSRDLIAQQNPPRPLDQKQVQNCYLLFERACGNILKTYFALLTDNEFLSLQSQEQIHEKLSYLNGVVEKTAVTLIKKLTRPQSFLTQNKRDQFIDQDGVQRQDSSGEVSCMNEQKTKKIKKRKPTLGAKQPTMSSKKKGKNTKIPNQSTFIMQKWLLQHFHDPYPTIDQKHKMSQQSGLTVYQVNNWFINARERVVKKFLKKDNPVMQAQSNARGKEDWEEEDNIGEKKEKREKRARKLSKSQLSERSGRVSKESCEKQGMEEEN